MSIALDYSPPDPAREISGFPVFGGAVLSYPVGGLNEYAVLETARQGGRIVWMPTINARHFVENSAGGADAREGDFAGRERADRH